MKFETGFSKELRVEYADRPRNHLHDQRAAAISTCIDEEMGKGRTQQQSIAMCYSMADEQMKVNKENKSNG